MHGANVLQQPVHQHPVDVVAAEMSVAVGGEHLEYPVLDPENGDVEGPPAEVVHRDGALGQLLQPIGQRGRGGLIDDAQHLEARDAARVLGRLALAVVEVGGHRDHRLFHLLAERAFSTLFQRTEYLGGDFGRRHLALPHPDADHLGGGNHLEGQMGQVTADVLVAPPHQPLHRVDRAGGIPDELPPRGIAHQHSRWRVRHDGGQERATVRVRDDPGHTTVDVGDQAVGGPEVNADDARHGSPDPLRALRSGRR